MKGRGFYLSGIRVTTKLSKIPTIPEEGLKPTRSGIMGITLGYWLINSLNIYTSLYLRQSFGKKVAFRTITETTKVLELHRKAAQNS